VQQQCYCHFTLLLQLNNKYCQLRDHLTPVGRLPMGGPWWPCVYLAPLRRYSAANVGRTDVDTEKRRKKERERGRRRERESKRKV